MNIVIKRNRLLDEFFARLKAEREEAEKHERARREASAPPKGITIPVTAERPSRRRARAKVITIPVTVEALSRPEPSPKVITFPVQVTDRSTS